MSALLRTRDQERRSGDPVKVLELLAYTIWDHDRDCGCGCGGEKRHDDNCRDCPPDCCDDEDDDDKDSE
jgi:hypothetical protein